MGAISRGLSGRRDAANVKLPPGRYLTADFPVLSAGPTPRVLLDKWEFTIEDGTNVLCAVELEIVSRTVHRESDGRSALRNAIVEARHILGRCFRRYTARSRENRCFLCSRAIVRWRHHKPAAEGSHEQAGVDRIPIDGDVAAEHGGPVRPLVPHLYVWKSAKRVRGITLMRLDQSIAAYADPLRITRLSVV
jgi:hypothetical protein